MGGDDRDLSAAAARLYGVRAYLQSDPHRRRRGAGRRAAGDHSARHRDARARRLARGRPRARCRSRARPRRRRTVHRNGDGPDASQRSQPCLARWRGGLRCRGRRRHGGGERRSRDDMKQMARRERLTAAINREPVDRVPYAVWRHFPAVDRSPAGLAQATLRFHERYGSDFLKLTPGGGYAVEAWGCVEGEEIRPDGHRPCASCAVREAGDWRKIRELDPGSAEGYVQQIEAIVRMGFDRRIGDTPVVPTLFSPLSLARKLSGGRLNADLRAQPGPVADALEAITATLIRFAELALSEGVSG